MSVDLTSALHERVLGDLPPYLSQSQIGVFMQCPERYRVEYIQGERHAASPALSIGSGVHKGIETYLSLRQQRVDPAESEKRALDAASAYVDGDQDGDAFEEATQARALVETYLRDAPPLNVVALEERIEVELPGLDVPLVGYIDCVADDRLVEIKTSARSVTKPTGVWKVQAWLYQAAHGLPMQWHVLVKTKQPKLLHGDALTIEYDRETTRRALDLAASTRRRIEQLYETLGPDQEWPLQGVLHPWACGMCAAQTTCIYGDTA